MAIALAVIGWFVAFVFFICWMVMCETADSLQRDRDRLSSRFTNASDTQVDLHNRLQSAEHDLNKLLATAKGIQRKLDKRGEGQ